MDLNSLPSQVSSLHGVWSLMNSCQKVDDDDRALGELNWNYPIEGTFLKL